MHLHCFVTRPFGCGLVTFQGLQGAGLELSPYPRWCSFADVDVATSADSKAQAARPDAKAVWESLRLPSAVMSGLCSRRQQPHARAAVSGAGRHE